MKARIAGVVKDSIVDGPGLRHAVFFQGCPHRCSGCHNQHTWKFNGGELMEIEEIAQAAIDDPLCSGVTLTGGEPLSQAEAACELAALCDKAGLSVWLYTGYKYEDVQDLPVFQHVEVVVDGPYIENLRDYRLEWRGSGNQRIIRLREQF